MEHDSKENNSFEKVDQSRLEREIHARLERFDNTVREAKEARIYQQKNSLSRIAQAEATVITAFISKLNI